MSGWTPLFLKALVDFRLPSSQAETEFVGMAVEDLSNGDLQFIVGDLLLLKILGADAFVIIDEHFEHLVPPGDTGVVVFGARRDILDTDVVSALVEPLVALAEPRVPACGRSRGWL